METLARDNIYKSEQCLNFGGGLGLKKPDVLIWVPEIIHTPRSPGGGTPHVNRQGGQDLKKIVTPNKYLRLTKILFVLPDPKKYLVLKFDTLKNTSF